MRLGPSASFFQNATVAQLSQGRPAAAESTVAAFRKISPTGPAALGVEADIELSRRDYPAAEKVLRQIREGQRASLLWQATTSTQLEAIAEARGRLAEAAQHQRDFMAESEARGLPRDYLVGATNLALIDVRYRNRPADALATVSAALAKHPLEALPAADRPYLSLATVYALARKPGEARRYLKEYEAAVPEQVRRSVPTRGLAYGAVAEAEGRPQDAIPAYREVYASAGFCGVCGLPQMAAAYDHLGQTDSARSVYQRYVDTPAAAPWGVDRSQLAAAYKRLGELYEARNDRKQAVRYYEKFVDLWKDADAELQPGVKEVRARLAKLAQEPGA
jgi:tetratricopeptide (TPR) repeat protein